MAKPINIESIERATGMTWSELVNELDKNDAKNMSHAQLAHLASSLLEGKIKSYEWWAQSVAVAYEQHIGRRIPGQLANGLFELAVSKTALESRNNLFPRVVKWFESQKKLNGREFIKPRSTETPKRSNWRCDFSDKSKFTATVEDNGLKSKLVLSHTDIPSQKQADAWKVYWQQTAQRLII